MMAMKTATVSVRVEQDVKQRAEAIMEQLGVPVSAVINMLYKQIIMTQSIPFSLSLPSTVHTRDDMTKEEFDAMMLRGLEEAAENRGRPVVDVCRELRQELE